jgi:hypothetical protein
MLEQLRRLQVVTDTALSHLSLDDLLQQLLHRVTEILEADGRPSAPSPTAWAPTPR